MFFKTSFDISENGTGLIPVIARVVVTVMLGVLYTFVVSVLSSDKTAICETIKMIVEIRKTFLMANLQKKIKKNYCHVESLIRRNFVGV
jgi:hypothetical protein